jgi:hypothetical protein
MYGPALANEYPSNGVDLWLKSTSAPVMKKFYYDEHHNGKSYHADHGEGLDCYKVAHTLGAGGIAPYVAEKLYVGDQYSTYNILEKGNLRSAFTLVYDSVKVGEDVYREEITITTSAGALLNRAVVKYAGKEQSMKLAAGIFLHGQDAVKGKLNTSETKYSVAYAEEATSDFGVPAGRNYVAVILPGAGKESMITDDHVLLLKDYSAGDELTYYFGGAWSNWGFANDEDWFAAVNRYEQQLANPLKISVK